MIPDFLKRENRKDSSKADKMAEAIKQYEEHFGEGLNTEPSFWSEKEWIEIIGVCIEKNKTLDELLERSYNSEDDD